VQIRVLSKYRQNTELSVTKTKNIRYAYVNIIRTSVDCVVLFVRYKYVYWARKKQFPPSRRNAIFNYAITITTTTSYSHLIESFAEYIFPISISVYTTSRNSLYTYQYDILYRNLLSTFSIDGFIIVTEKRFSRFAFTFLYKR